MLVSTYSSVQSSQPGRQCRRPYSRRARPLRICTLKGNEQRPYSQMRWSYYCRFCTTVLASAPLILPTDITYLITEFDKRYHWCFIYFTLRDAPRLFHCRFFKNQFASTYTKFTELRCQDLDHQPMNTLSRVNNLTENRVCIQLSGIRQPILISLLKVKAVQNEPLRGVISHAITSFTFPILSKWFPARAHAIEHPVITYSLHMTNYTPSVNSI